MHAPCPRAVVDEHVDHKNDLTCIMNLQPWTNCVGKWQKHELVTVIPIKQVPSPQIPLAMLKIVERKLAVDQSVLSTLHRG